MQLHPSAADRSHNEAHPAFDLAGAGTPQVDAGSQPDTQQVARWPVHQVEVEVVLQLRSIQHFEGNLGDLACWFARGTKQLVTAESSREQRQKINKQKVTLTELRTARVPVLFSQRVTTYLLLLSGEREYGETSLSLSKITWKMMWLILKFRVIVVVSSDYGFLLLSHNIHHISHIQKIFVLCLKKVSSYYLIFTHWCLWGIG